MMKTFFKKTILLSLPLFILLVGTNYFIDPANLFSQVEKKVATYVLEGQHVTNIYGDMDERSFQKEIIQKDQIERQHIVLGSSRMIFLNSDYYSPNFFNHSVSDATVEDLIAIYELYKEKGDFPQKITIGVDPWIFNQNYEECRWQSLDEEFYSFTSSPKIPISQFQLSRYAQLLSPSYFQASLKNLFTRMISKKSLEPTPTNIKINNTFTRLNDGSIIYHLEHRQLSPQAVENSLKSDPEKDLYALQDYTEFSQKRINLFNKLITDIQANGIEVEFVLMPYHPLVYSFMSENDDYQIVLEFEKYITDYTQKKNIPLLGSFDPAPYNLKNADFYDGQHLRETSVDSFIESF